MYVLHNLDKLAIFFASVKAGNRNTITQVSREGEHLVVNDEGPRQVDSFKDT